MFQWIFTLLEMCPPYCLSMHIERSSTNLPLIYVIKELEGHLFVYVRPPPKNHILDSCTGC